MPSLRHLLIQAAVLALQEGIDDGNTKDSSTRASQQRGISVSITDAIISWIKQTVIIISTTFFLLFTSLITFLLFYNLIMSPNIFIKPLYFDFSSILQHSNTQILNLPTMRPEADRNKAYNLPINTRSYPEARTDLYWAHTQWNAFNTHVAPPKRITRILKPDQSYFIDVALTLPDSEINRAIGVFMIEANLWDKNETLLALSRRSTMLPYESSLVKITRKILLIFFLLLGTVSEAPTVVVNMLDHFVENDKCPLSSVETRLILPLISTHHSLQIERAELRIGKELSPFQAILKKWFYTFALSMTTTFMILQALCLFWLWKWYNHKQNQYRHLPQRLHSYESDVDHWSHISATFSLVEDSASKNELSEENDEPKTSEHDIDKQDKISPLHEKEKESESSPVLMEEESSGADPVRYPYMDQKNSTPHQENKPYTKKKRNTISKDKCELRLKEEERERLQRVMDGKFVPFQIFTDLDEPD